MSQLAPALDAAGAVEAAPEVHVPDALAPAPPAAPVRVQAADGLNRSRSTVLLRPALAQPHLVWLTLWSLLVALAVVVNWFAVLVRARSPRVLHRFLSAYLRYHTHVFAFLFLLGDPFPGFVGRAGGYPVDVTVEAPARQARWRTLLRLPLLAIPAAGMTLVSVVPPLLALVAWPWCLLAGRMPRRLQSIGLWALSFGAHTAALGLVVTDRLPEGGRVFGMRWQPAPLPAPPSPRSDTRSRSRRVVGAAAALALAALWLLAAQRLWHTVVPGDLHLTPAATPEGDGAALKAEGLLVLGRVAGLVALAVFGVRGARLARRSAAGPIGTGIFLAMLGAACAFALELPFALAAWRSARENGLTDDTLLTWIASHVADGLDLIAVTAMLAAVSIGLARRMARRWWLVAALVIAGLMAGFNYIGLAVDEGPALRDHRLLADVRVLARREGIPHTRVRVIDLRDDTSAPNAFSLGAGDAGEVVLSGTIGDQRSARRGLRFVVAHELAHIARRHSMKRIGWELLFLLATGLVVSAAVRRRGGLGHPAAVPLAAFVFALAQFAWTPVDNAASRRYEAEADWIALGATRDAGAAASMLRTLASAEDEESQRPLWAHLFVDDHPTPALRISMTRAWSSLNRHARNAEHQFLGHPPQGAQARRVGRL